MAPSVTVFVAEPAPVAAIVVRTTYGDLPQHVERLLGKVRTAAAEHGWLTQDRVVIITRALGADGTVEASVGLQVAQAFAPAGEIQCRNTPAGRAACAVHEGPTEGLAATHTAILEWARDAGADLAGVQWEVHRDQAGVRHTEVFHLLDIEPSVVDY